jgi:UDPglucose--hexose-1-phosphate uridylyltransferase
VDKLRIERPDGRYAYLYGVERPLPLLSDPRHHERPDEPIELRWNPLLEEHVIVSTSRQERTFLPPPEYCPLCPTAPGTDVFTEVPASNFEIAVFENRFPGLRPDSPSAGDDSLLERRAPAVGICEVVVYSADHDATLASLPERQVRALVDVWADRYEELGRRPDVNYVFVFENRGKEIGVTLTHPHGQIYAFPFIPPRVEREHAAMRGYEQRQAGCLLCDTVAQEVSHGRRVIAAGDGWVAYVPFAARLPYEVHVTAAGHRASLLDLNDFERGGLARILRMVQGRYDSLWGFPMPYTMSMHQAAADGIERTGDHLHIEFAPPYRSRDKLKYLAGVETGAGTFINDTAPEEKAIELREAEPRT